MPSPREQALSIGTDPAKFREAAAQDATLPPEPKGQDYAANPKNPRDDGDPPYKITSQGG